MLLYCLRKDRITTMGKCKSIPVELTGEELHINIEKMTWEIQEVREEGLRVEVAASIYKDMTVALDEDLVSKMKKKKDIDM